MLSFVTRPTLSVPRRQPAPSSEPRSVCIKAFPSGLRPAGSKSWHRWSLLTVSAARDPRGGQEDNQTDYGSDEVPESWQDEWVSGNRHIEDADRSQTTPSGGTSSETMAARSWVDIGVARDESLAGGLGGRDAPAIKATRQAAEPSPGSGHAPRQSVGEGADVQDIE